MHLLCVWCVFFTSLACYPSVHLNIKSTELVPYPIPSNLWGPISVFLMFNVAALIGNFVAQFTSWPGPRYYWILVVARPFVLIPFFMFCNYLPLQRQPLPVLFANDYVYLFGSFVNAFTSGYFSSLSTMFGPKYAAILLSTAPCELRIF